MAGASLVLESGAKVLRKKKPPKKLTISEMFWKCFGSFSENCGNFSEDYR